MEEDAQIKILFVLSKTVVFLLLPSNFHCSDGCRRLQTAENAVFSRTAVAPKPDERRLLVTSAAHMHCDCLFPSGFCGVLTPSRFWGTSRYQCIVQSALLLGRNACKSNDATASSPGIAANVAVLVVAAIAV